MEGVLNYCWKIDKLKNHFLLWRGNKVFKTRGVTIEEIREKTNAAFTAAKALV